MISVLSDLRRDGSRKPESRDKSHQRGRTLNIGVAARKQ